MITKAFLMNVPKNGFRVFKNAKNSTFEHPKKFFGKMFYHFFVTFMENAFAITS